MYVKLCRSVFFIKYVYVKIAIITLITRRIRYDTGIILWSQRVSR